MNVDTLTKDGLQASAEAGGACASDHDPQRLIDAPVLVHVGMPKTATTWLQTHLFSSEEHGFFAPSPAEASAKRKVKHLAYLLYRDDHGRLINEEDFDAPQLRRLLAEVHVPPHLKAVISNERLCGNAFSNGFDRGVLSRRIRAVFPQARICLVIREQRAMVLSNYRQYLNYGGWHTIERFLDPPSDGRQPVLSPAFWHYDRLIGLYQSVFGAENVLALPFESFMQTPEKFVERICRFAGVAAPAGLPWTRKENSRNGYFAYYHLRGLTRLNRRTSANAHCPSVVPVPLGKAIDRGVKTLLQAAVPRSVDDGLAARLLARAEKVVGPDYFRDSNRRTAMLTGLPLAELGYKM